jgi:nucleotide-binding universal stress UspA family protein
MIADILVHVDPTKAGARRLTYAFDLAERHRAHLSGVHVLSPVDVPPIYKPSLVEQIACDLGHQHEREATASESLFRATALKRSAQTTWHSRRGGMASEICDIARCMDVTIVGQYEAESQAIRHPLSLAEEVVLHCGGPVLVVPPDVEIGRIHKALVVWDGSREAVRALHCALPLLRGGPAGVEIAVFGASPPEQTAQHLYGHLRRHGIDVANLQVPPAARVGTLLGRLQAGHFDLLIMGAYSRPAWLEFLIGGVTSSTLDAVRTPVLMSH